MDTSNMVFKQVANNNLAIDAKRNFTFKFLIFLGLFLMTTAMWAQKTLISGVVYDQRTKERLPFVNIYFEGTTTGTATDLDGNFQIETQDVSLTQLSISYLGYKKKTVDIKVGEIQDVSIELEIEGQILQEVIISDKKKFKKDTAAIRIYRSVVRNKEKNRPSGMDSYAYEEYSKTEFDLYNISEKLKKNRALKSFDYYFNSTDTTATGEEYLPFLIKERITDHYFTQSPNQKKEIVKADRTTTVIEDKLTEILNYAFEPIDVYDNMFLVNEKAFISPFGKGAIANYKYFLADSSKIEGQKYYKLEFTGRRKQDLAFSGHAWIQDKSFAIQSIELYVLPQVNLNFVNNFGLKQSFKQVNGVWFKKNESIFTNVNFSKNKEKQSFLIKKYINRENIKVNEPIDNAVFEGENLEYNDDAYEKEDEYWVKNRHEKLSDKEAEIIFTIDSLKTTKAYKNVTWWTYALTTAYLQAGPIEFGRFYQFFSWNAVEGNRYKIEARTNWGFSKKLQLDGYAAYGDKDNSFKYGIGFRSHLKRVNKKWHMFGGHFKDDIIQLDQRDILLTHDNLALAILRSEPLSRLLRVRRFNLYHEKEWVKDLTINAGFTHQRLLAVSDELTFRKNTVGSDGTPIEQIVEDITTTEFNVNLSWTREQVFHEGRFVRVPLSFKKPVFYFNYTLGLKNILGADYSYNKLELVVRHRWDTYLGSTFYQGTLGKVFGNAPYPLLKVHRGNQNFIAQYWAFELMSEFEYASDEYAMLWVRHGFNGLILNQIPLLNKLKWRSVLVAKAAAGRLKQENIDLVQLPSGMTPLDGLYLEAGFGVENIFKVIRVTALWRITPQNPLREDTQMWGIKLSLHPTL